MEKNGFHRRAKFNIWPNGKTETTEPSECKLNGNVRYIYIYVVEWSRALDVRLSECCCSVSMVMVQIPSREEQKFDSSKNLILTLFGLICRRIYIYIWKTWNCIFIIYKKKVGKKQTIYLTYKLSMCFGLSFPFTQHHNILKKDPLESVINFPVSSNRHTIGISCPRVFCETRSEFCIVIDNE